MKKTRFYFYTKEKICWEALNGDIDIFDAADALVHSDSSMQDPFSFVYPEAEILEKMLYELHMHPQERNAIENMYREPALQAFNALLDIFTTPDGPAAQPKSFPIPRSLSNKHR